MAFSFYCVTTYWQSFSSHNRKFLCSLHHKTSKSLSNDSFHMILLLDFNIYADAVDTRFYQDLLFLASGDGNWIQHHTFGAPAPTYQHTFTVQADGEDNNNNNNKTYGISTSGLLCRSTVCDGKFRRHRAASRVVRTASRYGLSVFDCTEQSIKETKVKHCENT